MVYDAENDLVLSSIGIASVVPLPDPLGQGRTNGGWFRVNFTTPLANTRYLVQATTMPAEIPAPGTGYQYLYYGQSAFVHSKTASSVDIWTGRDAANYFEPSRPDQLFVTIDSMP